MLREDGIDPGFHRLAVEVFEKQAGSPFV